MPTSEQLAQWTATDEKAHRLIKRIRSCVAERHRRERLHESDSFVLFRKLPLELQQRIACYMDCHTQWKLTQTCTELQQCFVRPDRSREPRLVLLKTTLDCFPFTRKQSEFEGQNGQKITLPTRIVLRRNPCCAGIFMDYDDIDEHISVNGEWYVNWDILLGHPLLQQTYSLDVIFTGSGSVSSAISEWYDTLPIELWDRWEMHIWIEDEKNAKNSCIISKDVGGHKKCFLDTRMHWCEFEHELKFDWSEMPLGYKWAIVFKRENDEGGGGYYDGMHRVWSKDEFDVEVVRELNGFLWRHNSIIPKPVEIAPEYPSDVD